MDWQNGREDGLQDASSTPATYSGPLNDFLGMIGNREAVEANLVRHYDSLIKNYARSREELQMAQATASLWQKTYNEMEKKLAAAETELVEIKTANVRLPRPAQPHSRTLIWLT